MSLERCPKAWKNDYELETRGRIDSVQATARLRSIRIEESWNTDETYSQLDSSEDHQLIMEIY